jgi:hypothetical protein
MIDRRSPEQIRRDAMNAAWMAYHAQFKKPLKPESDAMDDNAITNRCAPIVNKGVSFLFGQDIRIEIRDEYQISNPDTPPSDEQNFLDAVWRKNRQMTLLAKLAMQGAITGHAYLRIMPSQNVPRLVVLDSQRVEMEHDPDDIDIVTKYCIYWTGKNAEGGTVAKKQEISWTGRDWIMQNYLQKAREEDWLPDGPSIPWRYTFPPIVDCQNLINPNELYGLPDLSSDIIQHNDILNFVQSNISRIIKYHASPVTWGTGFNPSQMRKSIDAVIVLPDSATLQNLEMQSDLASSMRFVEMLRSDMDEVSRIPGVALGRLTDLPRGDVSGVALQLMFQPLIEKTEMKRRLYGELIEETCQRILVLAGFSGDVEIVIHWPKLLPTDENAVLQSALLKDQLGISKKTLINELGYNAEMEMEQNQEEAQASLSMMTQGRDLPPYGGFPQ